MSSPHIIFYPDGKRIEYSRGGSLLEAAKSAGVDVQSLCGGSGLCGKCKVIVREGSGSLSPINEVEKRFLLDREVEEGFRLACQSRIVGLDKIIVEVPPQSRVGHQRLLLRGLEREVELMPAVRNVTVHVEKPSLEDAGGDVDRLLESLKRKIGREIRIDYEALKRASKAIRDGDWKVTATLWMNREVISVNSDAGYDRLYGLAVDVGTTKVAAYLLDLNTGGIVAASSRMNPQIPYGEDVISRITYIMKDEEKNLKTLHKRVIECVNDMIVDLCGEAGVSPEDIYDVTIVGNTAMHHIFLGLSPKYVSLSPYPAALQSSINIKAREVDVKVNPGAYVHALPNIAGFVGADAVADALATEIHESEEISILVDIGTNTEVILGNRERLIACSCASGPAFEGAHIKHGMRAATGAIEHVWINPEDLEANYSTIDDARPRGLCGSAVIDAVAWMLRVNIISWDGRFNMDLDTRRVRVKDGNPEFVIAWKDESEAGEDIVITQRDVREIQLAKAAIYTGISILMKNMNVDLDDIGRVYVAGAFGNYIDPESGRIIGMLPDIPLRRIEFVGNTAGSGARATLKSTEMRRKAEIIAKQIEYVELGADPNFQREFIKALYLPHKEIERFPMVAEMLRQYAAHKSAGR